MKVLEHWHEVNNFTLKEILRHGHALSGDALEQVVNTEIKLFEDAIEWPETFENEYGDAKDLLNEIIEDMGQDVEGGVFISQKQWEALCREVEGI